MGRGKILQVQNLGKNPRGNYPYFYVGSLRLISTDFLEGSRRTRGHSFKLKKKRTNTDLRQQFFSERIVNIWNALDDDSVCSSSLNGFRNGLHQLWKNDRLPMGLL